MTFLTLAACLALTTFLAVILVASAVSALLWQTAVDEVDTPSASRAAGLFQLRLLPSLAGVVIAAGVFAPAFCAFEPRVSGETAGPVLIAAAVVALALILRTAYGAAHAWMATRRLARKWLRDSTPVRLPGVAVPAHAVRCDFPVVSVVGVMRPRLFISDRVLGACSADEILAVAAHERGHLAAGDNLRRLVLRVCPDLFSLLPFGRLIERQWHEASEDAADDYTVRAHASPVALANALVRVARLAGSMTPPWLPSASLYDGDPVERRVRRLLAMENAGVATAEGERASKPARWVLLARVAVVLPVALAAIVLARPHLLRGVHQFIEAVVETLC